MKRLILAAALLLCPVLASAQGRPATGEELAALRAGMDRKLLDSESARFKDVMVSSDPSSGMVCGMVNAKNSYGAYTGFKRFLAMRMGSQIWPVDVDDSTGFASDECRKAGLL